MLADWQVGEPGLRQDRQSLATVGRTLPGGTQRRQRGAAIAGIPGLSALEVGSDIGGSIRVPAAFCGVYGHRPSETLLPRSGTVPHSRRCRTRRW
jgi:amidase